MAVVTTPSEIDHMDVASWKERAESGKTILEETINNYPRTKHLPSYEGTLVGLPKLIKICDEQVLTMSGPYRGDPLKRPSNAKVRHYDCRFLHPSGEHIDIRLPSVTISNIAEYKEVIDDYHKLK